MDVKSIHTFGFRIRLVKQAKKEETILNKTNNETLKNLRIDNDLSQEEMAKILDTTQQQYGRYELGQRELKQEQIKKLCMHFKVSADYILGLPKGLKWPR